MTRDYTMDDFHAEMRRRGVTGRIKDEHCASCGGTSFVDAIDDQGQSYRGCAHCRVTPVRNLVVAVLPCNRHPLHFVKMYANGSRSGCPMCTRKERP
jgi:hypothetical protein